MIEGVTSLKMIRRNGLRAIAVALFTLATLAAAPAQQLAPALQGAIGHWQVINDDGKPNGHVETYLVEGKLFGKVTQLRPGRQPGDVCDKCPGDLKNKPLMGLVILRNFRPEGNDWVGGTVIDPENGKEYKGKLWMVGADTLSMRGFIGFSLLGRTQNWKRLP
jgi:uncharacterized protein (DUF2147 family)